RPFRSGQAAEWSEVWPLACPWSSSTRMVTACRVSTRSATSPAWDTIWTERTRPSWAPFESCTVPCPLPFRRTDTTSTFCSSTPPLLPLLRPVVACLAQRLMVVFVPEQGVIASMGFDVVDDRGCLYPAGC